MTATTTDSRSAAPDLSSRPQTPEAYDAGFVAAAAVTGVVERHFRIAGRRLTLRFAGDALTEPVCRALAHLEFRGRWATPDLAVHLWDSQSTGVPPLLPEPAHHTADSAGPWTLERFGHLQVGHRADQVALSALDPRLAAAWYWVREPGLLEEWDRAAPLRALIHWWLAEQGIQLLHGGAVGVGPRGALLVGRGGSGKSTATLACVRDGMDYAGDDFVAAAPATPPTVHSIYSSAKLEPHHLRRFPDLLPGFGADVDSTPPDQKLVAYLSELLPDRCRPGFTLNAMLVPSFHDGARSYLEPATRAEVLQALAPSSLFLLPGAARQRTLTELTRIVAAVPSYRLRMGHDLTAIAAAVGRSMEVQT